MATRTTQEYIEVVQTPTDPEARVTQVYIEVVQTYFAEVLYTQEYLEVVTNNYSEATPKPRYQVVFVG